MSHTTFITKPYTTKENIYNNNVKSNFKEIRNYVKIYPEFIKVIQYNRPIITQKNTLPSSGCGLEADEESTQSQDYLAKSIARTKTTISDYILCNDFDHFATFTFDQKKIGSKNRYSFLYCANKLSEWLRTEQQHHKRKYSTGFRYLIVPEQHKDGAWHFHAIIGGYLGPTPDFLSKKNSYLLTRERKQSSLRTRKFIQRYALGRNEIQPIKDKNRLSNYIKKYITKSLISLPGKKRYWCSRNLQKPRIAYNVFDKIPETPQTLIFDSGYFKVFKLQRSLFPLLSQAMDFWQSQPPKKPLHNFIKPRSTDSQLAENIPLFNMSMI